MKLGDDRTVNTRILLPHVRRMQCCSIAEPNQRRGIGGEITEKFFQDSSGSISSPCHPYALSFGLAHGCPKPGEPVFVCTCQIACFVFNARRDVQQEPPVPKNLASSLERIFRNGSARRHNRNRVSRGKNWVLSSCQLGWNHALRMTFSETGRNAS